MDVSRKLFCCSFLLIALLLTGSIAQDSTNYTETTTASLDFSSSQAGGEEANTSEILGAETQEITTIPTTDPTENSTSQTEQPQVGGDDSTTLSQAGASSTETQVSEAADTTQSAVLTSEETNVEQTTTQQDTTTSGQATPAITDAHSSHTVCGVSEGDIDAESPCHYKNHETYSRPENGGDGGNVPVREWVLFTDPSEENCLRIPMQTNGSCFATGSCGTDFPYYLTANSYPAENTSDTVDLCATVRTLGTKRYTCCQGIIEVTVHNCLNKYFVYRLEKTLQIDGSICLSKTDNTFYKTVKNNEKHGLIFKDLNEEERENVVAVVIGYEDAENFKSNMADVEKNLKKRLAEKLNEAGVLSTERKKRASGQGSDLHVDTLYGYPTTNEEEKETTYVILVIHTKKVVPKDKVKRALNEMEGEKLVAGISVKQVEESLPSELAYRTTAQYEHTAQPTKQDRLWIAILVIIGVTAFIVALAFVAVWCFSARRRGRSGNLMVSSAYKEPLVGEDEMNNSYKQVQDDSGHVNHAMELESGYVVSIDDNQNHGEKSLQPIEDNAV